MTENHHVPGWEGGALSSAPTHGDAEYFLFPVTPQQQSIWEAHRSGSGTAIYNGAFRFEIKGPCDPKRLEAALNRLIERHEILRANCKLVDGRPMMAVSPVRVLALRCFDLRGQASVEREVEQICQQEAEAGFDLEQDLLIRAGLIRTGDDRALFMLTLHNFVCDGYSLSILLNELAEVYAAMFAGREANLNEVALQFGDYSTWLVEQHHDPEYVRQSEYWRRQLQGYHRLDVPGDLVVTEPKDRSSAIVSREIPSPLIDKLKSLCTSLQCTFFVVGLAALLALLKFETGAAEVSTGAPVAGRSQQDLEDVVGPLINYVIMQARTAMDATFGDYVEVARKIVLDAFANQDVALEDLRAALASTNTALPDPAFATCFVCQKGFTYSGTQNFSSEKTGFEMFPIPSKSQGSVFDLYFFLIEREEGWRVSIDYLSQRYSRKKAEQLLENYSLLLRAMADDPNARSSEAFERLSHRGEEC